MTNSLNISNLDLSSLCIDGIDTGDAPDFCDAFVCEAQWNDGTELTEEEMEMIPSDIINQAAFEECF